jgi:hypothetical protein
MAEPKTYTGQCHCGAVKYRVTLELNGAISCNCSICTKTGSLLAFAPAARFELLSGEGVLADYQFGKRRIHHQFCSRCGVRSFAHGAGPDGAETFAVNVRCLDGIELSTIPLRPFDGRSLPLE